MRYAVCMSGMMRGFSPWLETEKIHRNLRSAFAGLDHDFFVATYAIAGVQRGKIQNFSWRYPEIGISEDTVRSVYGERLKSVQIFPFEARLYTPEWMLEHAHDEMHLSQRLSAMYFQIHESNRLKKQYAEANGITYDVTIRCRPDLDFYLGGVWEAIQASEIKPGVIYTPHIESFGFTCDQFFWGDSTTIDSVSHLWHHLAARSNLIVLGSPSNPLDPAERLFQTYLDRLGVEVRRRDIHYIRCT